MHPTSAFFSPPAVIEAEIGLQLLKGEIYYSVCTLTGIVVGFASGLLATSLPLKNAERADFSYLAIFIGVVHACYICPYLLKSRVHN